MKLESLLADGMPDAGTAVAIMVATAIGGAIKVVWDQAVASWREKRGDSKEEKKTIEAHLNARIDRLEEEKARADERERKRSKRLRRADNSNAQMKRHIMYLEGLFKHCKEIEFSPYQEVPLPDDDDETLPGTDVHRSLPSPRSESDGAD